MSSTRSSAAGASARWVAIDHVQVAIPIGGEDEARRFYAGLLGLSEVPKPAVMAARGGAWFESGVVRVHVGAEDAFVPARKAHPGLTMNGLAEFIGSSGLDATWNTEIPDIVRCHVFDPFGNRIELIDAGNDVVEAADVADRARLDAGEESA
ncbi:glyoxalase [Ilumatobacter sp.]|uniref:glyoxalase n=1 Tax=Ilumatobacter sp. TaxID=1967498 RepID=UPI003C666ABD